MVNRAAVILKYKQPFIQWINDADPYNDNPGITFDRANNERTVYLISDEDADAFDEWLSLNYMILFENELEDWYTDESLWPKERNRKVFDKWFNVECHSVLIDTVGSEIVDEDI